MHQQNQPWETKYELDIKAQFKDQGSYADTLISCQFEIVGRREFDLT